MFTENIVTGFLLMMLLTSSGVLHSKSTRAMRSQDLTHGEIFRATSDVERVRQHVSSWGVMDDGYIPDTCEDIAAAALSDVHPFEGREVVTVGSLVELRYVNEVGRDILTTEMLVPAAAWCP